jgi:hypothetical protein
MLRAILIVITVVLVIAAVGAVWMLKGPDLSPYKVLNNPRISSKPDAWALVVPFEVPAAKMSGVFGVLMKTYYSLSGVPKGLNIPAPRARYANTSDLSLPPEKRLEAFKKAAWKGAAAIPVPESVTALPVLKNNSGFTPQLAKWPYGEVAEILHVGSYDTEPATIEKLYKYIQEQNYIICGEHEEEYLRGPGMPFSEPDNYVTIIRYQVKKRLSRK